MVFRSCVEIPMKPRTQLVGCVRCVGVILIDARNCQENT